jgi:hypothetical protein
VGKDAILLLENSKTVQESTIEAQDSKKKAPSQKQKEIKRQFIEKWGQLIADPMTLHDLDATQQKEWTKLWGEWANAIIIRRTITDASGEQVPDPLKRVESFQQYIRDLVPSHHEWRNIRILYCAISVMTGNTMAVVHGMKRCDIKKADHSSAGRIRFEYRRSVGEIWQRCMSAKCQGHHHSLGPVLDPVIESIFSPAESLERYKKKAKAVAELHPEEEGKGFQMNLKLSQKALELNPQLAIQEPILEKKRSKHSDPLTKDEKKENREKSKHLQMFYNRDSRPPLASFGRQSFQSAEQLFADAQSEPKKIEGDQLFKKRPRENDGEEPKRKKPKPNLPIIPDFRLVDGPVRPLRVASFVCTLPVVFGEKRRR